jgi:DNA-binding transcriptional ArsR family regulator
MRNKLYSREDIGNIEKALNYPYQYSSVFKASGETMNVEDSLDWYFKVMAHLSNEKERIILSELLEKGQRETSDFEKILDMTKSSIMRLLSRLEEDGLIESGELDEKRAGRRKKYYKIRNIELPGMNIQDIREFLLEKKIPKGVQSKEIFGKFNRMKRISVRGRRGHTEFDPTLLISDLILSGLGITEAIEILLEFETQLVEGISPEEISDGITKLLEKKDPIYAETYRDLVKKDILLEPSTHGTWNMEEISEMIKDQFELKENETRLIVSEFGRFVEFLGYYRFSYNYLMQTLYLLTRKHKMDARKPNLGSFWIPEGSELMIVGESTNKEIFSAMLRDKKFEEEEKNEINELRNLLNKYYGKFMEKAHNLKIIIPSEDYSYHRRINVLKGNAMDTWAARNFGNYIERTFHLSFHKGQYIGTEVFRILQRLNLGKVPISLVYELCEEVLVEKGMRKYKKSEKKVEIDHFFNFKNVETLLKSERSSALNYLIENMANKENLKHIHIHGINGWLAVPNQLQHDLRWFLVNGHNRKPVVGPPENITELIQLIIRIVEEFDGEVALSQNFDFFNILISPFFKGMKYETIKRYIHLLISELDRKTYDIGLSIELGIPGFLENHSIWTKQKIGETYSDFESESLNIARAILEVLAEGDPAGNSYQNPKIILKLRNDFSEREDILNMIPLIFDKYSKHVISGNPPPLIIANCVNDSSSTNSSYLCNGQGIQFSNWENSFGVSNLQTISLNMSTLLGNTTSEDEARKKIEEITTIVASALTQKRDIIGNGLEKSKFQLLSMPTWEGRNYYLNLMDSFSTIGIFQMRKALSNIRRQSLEESEDILEFSLRLVSSVQTFIDRHMEEMGDRGSRILISQPNLFSSIQKDTFHKDWLPIQFTEANIRREERIQQTLRGGKIFYVEKPDIDFQDLLTRLTNSSIRLFAFVPEKR